MLILLTISPQELTLTCLAKKVDWGEISSDEEEKETKKTTGLQQTEKPAKVKTSTKVANLLKPTKPAKGSKTDSQKAVIEFLPSLLNRL